MSCLSAKEDEHEDHMSDISQDAVDTQTFSFKMSSSRSPMQCPRENMKTLNSDQADLFSHVDFLDPIKTDGPAKAAFVNGSASPHISDEIFLDISKNVPGFIPKGFHAQNSSVTTSNTFDLFKNEGEMTIRQMLTAEDVENRGIWGFDMESPESSSDDYDNGNDISWDPQREFMRFLWDDHDDPDMIGKMSSFPSSTSQRRRKRKMDMVVMVDPSEDHGTDLRHGPQSNSLDEGTKSDPCSINKEQSIKKQSKLQLPPVAKHAQSSNGNTEAVLKSQKKKSTSRSRKLGLLKDHPSADSGSEEEPSFFPCTKCNINFKEKTHLHRHMKYHSDAPNYVKVQRLFTCNECGWSLRNRSSLLRHMNIHQEKRQKLVEEIKGLNEHKDEGQEARFQCPQCIFGTNCSNTFVQHAKTHEKDKRYYGCQQCDFMAVTEYELESHVLKEHRNAQSLTEGKSDGLEKLKVTVSEKKSDLSCSISFPCKMCSFSSSDRTTLRKHIELVHEHNFGDEYESSDCQEEEDSGSYLSKVSFVSKSAVIDVQSPEKAANIATEHQPHRNEKFPSRLNQISSLVEEENVKLKEKRGFKSRLDKSISILLSRQKPCEQRKLEYNSGHKSEKDKGTTFPRQRHSEGPIHLKSKSTRSERTTSSPSYRKPALEPEQDDSKIICNNFVDTDIGKGHSNPHKSYLTLESPIPNKSPSKRKMSTPYHNKQGQDILSDFPKCMQNGDVLEMEKIKKKFSVTNEYSDDDSFKIEDSDLSSSPLKCGNASEDQSVSNRFISRRKSPSQGSFGVSDGIFEQTSSENGQKFVVKEECMETKFGDLSESATSIRTESFSDCDTDLKSCPYCPAVFQSGVGLSNHIRGHLRRVGLSYDARHGVSAAQVASQDKVPCIRRRIAAVHHITTGMNSTSAEQHTVQATEQETEQQEHLQSLTCPLCGDSFNTGTGLSNHVRGHLKRLGKAFSTAALKSPVLVLKDLMDNKKQFHMKLQALKKKCGASCTADLFKSARPNGLLLPSTARAQSFRLGVRQHESVSSQSFEERREKKKVETKDGVRTSPSSDLIGILKKRKAHEETKLKSQSQTARKALHISPAKEHGAGMQLHKPLPNSIAEKSDLNKRVCVHCNATFHSGVSLSNHLRAYARRKRNALLEGTTYDCKQRKQRSRSGSKKKTHPLLHAPEEIYRLTCRFCDLVFQGPLSVQEDWIKHLQRHIMNASVPHTGASMMEVTSFPKDPNSDTEQPAQTSMTQVAS